jgi:two-component system LytT family response regulator
MKNHQDEILQQPVTLQKNQSKNVVDVIIRGRTTSIENKDITHMEGEGNYTFLYTRQGKRYLISKTIKTLHESDKSFIRVHKSFAVNSQYVVEWIEPFTLLLSTGRQVSVARRRARQTEQLLAEFREAV